MSEDLVRVVTEALASEQQPERRRELFRQLGRSHEEGLHQYRDAAQAYARGLEEFPDSPRLLQDLARCLEALGDHAALLPVVKRQLLLDSEPHRQALLHSRVATLCEALGDPDQALVHYREAVKRSPRLDPPVQGLMAIAEVSGDWVGVLEVLTERLKVEARPRERGMILTRAGELLATRLGDREQAVSYFERAIREHPRALQPRLKLLELLCAQGQFARAERFATPPDAAESHGLSPDALAQLAQFRAQVANERGRPVEAVECLCLALKVATDPTGALDSLIQLARGERPEMPPPPSLLRLAGEWESQGRNAPAAQALHAAALLDLGWGKLERAEASLRKAVALQPGELELRLALASIHRTGRQHSRAVEVLTTAALQLPQHAAALLAEAARILADHQHLPTEARALLRGLRESGRATPATRVLEAGLAFTLGDREEAAGLLDQVPHEGAPGAALLRLKLVEARSDDEATRIKAREVAAATGSPRLLRQLISQRFHTGGLEATEQLLEAIPVRSRPAAMRLAGDVLRQAGRTDEAQYCYLRAHQSDPTSVDALGSLALVAPREAASRLRGILEQNPFHARAAALLSSLLTADGADAHAEAMTHVAVALRGELTPAQPVELQTFARVVATLDPLLTVVQSLRDGLTAVFDHDEAALYAESRPAPLSPELRDFWEQAAALFTDAPPELRISRRVGGAPIVLTRPEALLISPVLLHQDMPTGAMVAALLRGLGAWVLGLGPLTYTGTYRLDVLGEALRVSERRPERAGAMVAESFDLPAEQATAALSAAFPLAQGRRTDLVGARVHHEERLVRAALVSTRDLTGALSAAALHAPARVAPAATGERWQRLLSRIPHARTVLAYALTDHFATLFAPPEP